MNLTSLISFSCRKLFQFQPPFHIDAARLKHPPELVPRVAYRVTEYLCELTFGIHYVPPPHSAWHFRTHEQIVPTVQGDPISDPANPDFPPPRLKGPSSSRVCMCFMQLSHIMKIYAHARTLFLAARPAKIPPHSTSTADKTQTEQCCSSVCECVAQIRWKCSSFPSPEAPPLCLRLTMLGE